MNKPKKTKVEMPKELLDSDGNKMPTKFIDKHILNRHMLVTELVAEAKEIEEILMKFKAKIASRLDEFNQNMILKSGLDQLKHMGNYTLYNFDKTQQIEVNNHGFITFDERINVAKGLISEYLSEKTQDIDNELMLIINKAFQTDKKGQFDTKRIVDLKDLKIKHPTWKKAMEIIHECTLISKRKKYYNIKVRDAEGGLRNVNLNFSSVNVFEVEG